MKLPVFAPISISGRVSLRRARHGSRGCLSSGLALRRRPGAIRRAGASRSRLMAASYCATAGGFTEHHVPINERTRAMGTEVLEIIDRAVEFGMLPPAPAEKACSFCDFLPVCGPEQERRA